MWAGVIVVWKRSTRSHQHQSGGSEHISTFSFLGIYASMKTLDSPKILRKSLKTKVLVFFNFYQCTIKAVFTHSITVCHSNCTQTVYVCRARSLHHVTSQEWLFHLNRTSEASPTHRRPQPSTASSCHGPAIWKTTKVWNTTAKCSDSLYPRP